MSSPHTGESLSSMAAQGTSLPNDAGVQTTIPSVPREDQRVESSRYSFEGIGAPSLVRATDNDLDIPRSTRDRGSSGEVVSAMTGDTMPASVEEKNLSAEVMGDPGAKGSQRSVKHGNKNRSAFDRFAGEDRDAADRIADKEQGV
ncbi:hypothetical protein ASPZODRAFT_141653 [Penicilliopsis zonata CBS 506.65]|uniref:Uncharacterized protein n=1 Tax=Penicilliopsis zonata CBS 506.65 TaxID=1073090 RepID=A0A1L9SIE1_9EURO|nr:hypothetical protein ASPZODRAFT_141653 [Penicilliopsis zonata CBS 506.65]OJJ46871.1 hypothetical protein ASPZODRAFT_141653 [Penicilliopsis zonata CBS 506.65]